MPRLPADALCGPVSGPVSSHYGALPVRPSPTRSRSQLVGRAAGARVPVLRSLRHAHRARSAASAPAGGHGFGRRFRDTLSRDLSPFEISDFFSRLVGLFELVDLCGPLSCPGRSASASHVRARCSPGWALRRQRTARTGAPLPMLLRTKPMPPAARLCFGRLPGRPCCCETRRRRLAGRRPLSLASLRQHPAPALPLNVLCTQRQARPGAAVTAHAGRAGRPRPTHAAGVGAEGARIRAVCGVGFDGAFSRRRWPEPGADSCR